MSMPSSSVPSTTTLVDDVSFFVLKKETVLKRGCGMDWTKRPLERKTGKEVSLSAFAHLFAAMIGQAQARSVRVAELEERLAALV